MKMGWEEFIAFGIIIVILAFIYDCAKDIRWYLKNILAVLQSPRRKDEDYDD